MSIFNVLTRTNQYYKRHGLKNAINRAGIGLKRALFSNRMVVFYCDLPKLSAPRVNIPAALRVERLRHRTDLNASDLHKITSFWNPKQAHRNIQERFEKGASLWLVKSGDKLAGYGWTIQGRTIAEYYFLIGTDDVQFFDFYVFPKFRGRALHWLLTVYILQMLAAEGRARAFADTAEWNQAQLASFKMTPFRRLGVAQPVTLFGRTFVSWAENAPVAADPKTRKELREEQPMAGALRSRE
jgi:hypothetical protein